MSCILRVLGHNMRVLGHNMRVLGHNMRVLGHNINIFQCGKLSTFKIFGERALRISTLYGKCEQLLKATYLRIYKGNESTVENILTQSLWK